MFMIDSQSDLLAFVEANNGKVRLYCELMNIGVQENVAWEVQNGRVHFKKEKTEQKEIPSFKMINLCLDYAAELNKII